MSAESAATRLPTFIGNQLLKFNQGPQIPIDQLCLVIIMLISILIGPIFKSIKFPFIRHIVSISLGLYFGYIIVGLGVFHIILNSVIVYFIVKLCPPNLSPTIVWAISLSYLAFGHIHRQIYDYRGWSMDFTLLQMIATVKQISFACNVSDGMKLNKNSTVPLHSDPKVHSYFVSTCVRKFPSLLEFFSYIFFYAAVLCGPPFDYVHFQNYMNGSLYSKDGLTSPPNSILNTIKYFVIAMISYVIFTISGTFSMLDGYIISDKFLNETTFAYRLFHLIAGMTLLRFRYYFAWYMTEAGCVSCGISYNGIKDGVPQWDKLNNIDPIMVETGTHFPDIISAWNKNVNLWLKYCVYCRVKRPLFLSFMSDKSFSNIATKMTSAFWHGFYAGYYLFFFLVAIANFMDDELRRVVRPLVYKDSKDIDGNFFSVPIASTFVVFLYNFFISALNHLILNYLCISFALLDGYEAIRVWSSTYFIGHILTIVILVILKYGFPVKRVKKVHTENLKNVE